MAVLKLGSTVGGLEIIATEATPTSRGLMSAEDKKKLDGIDAIIYNIKVAFDAVGDGIADDTQAFLDMASFVNSRDYTQIYIPQGIYKINEEIKITRDCNIFGDAESHTVLDFSTATGLFPDQANLLLTGADPVALPSITTDIAKNSLTITFSTTPELQVGDIITIQDTTDYSWGLFRNYYRKAEMARVIEINGTTITVDRPMFDDYASSTLIAYKLNTIIADVSKITIKAKPTVETGLTVLKLQYVKNSSVSNYESFGTNQSHLTFHNSYNCLIESIYVDYPSTPIGLNYGVVISNCAKINIADSFLKTARHGIAIGGSDLPTAVINRDINITNCKIASYTTLSADCHGSSEFITYESCIIDDGITVGGDNIIVKNNIIRTDPTGLGINIGEAVGNNFTFVDNDITCPIYTQVNAAGYGVIRTTTANYTRSGEIIIRGNKIKLLNNGVAIYIYNPNTTSRIINLLIDNNTIYVENPSHANPAGIAIGGLFKIIKVYDNFLERADIFLNPVDYLLLEVKGNTVFLSENYGTKIITKAGTPDGFILDFKDNKIIRPGYGGVMLYGHTAGIGTVLCNNNLSIDANEIATTGSTTTDSNFQIANFKYAEFRGNILGDTRTTPKQARTYYLGSTTLLFDSENINLSPVTIASTILNITQNVYKQAWSQDGQRRYLAYGTTAPTTGTWARGSIVYHSAPAVGSPLGWVCTVAGTPGTWVALPAV